MDCYLKNRKVFTHFSHKKTEKFFCALGPRIKYFDRFYFCRSINNKIFQGSICLAKYLTTSLKVLHIKQNTDK